MPSPPMAPRLLRRHRLKSPSWPAFAPLEDVMGLVESRLGPWWPTGEMVCVVLVLCLEVFPGGRVVKVVRCIALQEPVLAK